MSTKNFFTITALAFSFFLTSNVAMSSDSFSNIAESCPVAGQPYSVFSSAINAHGAGEPPSVGASFPECGIIFHNGDSTRGSALAPGAYIEDADETINVYDLNMLNDWVNRRIPEPACWQLTVMDLDNDRRVTVLDSLILQNLLYGSFPDNMFPRSTRLRGDVNDDGHVFVHPGEAARVSIQNGNTVLDVYTQEDSDLYVLQQYLNGTILLTQRGLQQADFNGDEVIDYADLEEIAACFGAPYIPVPPGFQSSTEDSNTVNQETR